MARVLVIVERFYPEDFLVNDLVAAWQDLGDEVEVLTQVPSYPRDKIFDGYENRRYQVTREYRGIPVHRVSTIFGYNESVRRKILNYLHFGWRTACWCLWHGRRFDRVFVYHTAALTMAVGVWPLKIFWRKPIAIWTQDLWPDAVYAFGFHPSRIKSALLNLFVRSVYACCDRIAVSCPSYVRRIREICGRKAEFVPQWDPTTMSPESHPQSNRHVFMFAGNMGVPQDLPNVIRGFAEAKLADAELWLLGGGVMLEELKALVSRLGLANVHFKGRQPKSEMGGWFAQASVLIISLTREYRLTFPGKFQSYIKTGRPLLGILEGDARDLIESERLGVTADPSDVASIAAAFRNFPFHRAETFGRNCLRLSAEKFDRDRLVARLREMQ